MSWSVHENIPLGNDHDTLIEQSPDFHHAEVVYMQINTICLSVSGFR